MVKLTPGLVIALRDVASYEHSKAPYIWKPARMRRLAAMALVVGYEFKDKHGVERTAYRLTDAGRAALKEIGGVDG